MATVNDLIKRCESLENQRVTVPTNPYGGQCAAYVDFLAQEFTDKNLSYTNAIDLLYRAAQNGFPVEFFNGHNLPKDGDFFVSDCYNHNFGHTGVFLKGNNSTVVTSEQNVDLNPDALTNGGWVREKERTIHSDGTFER